MNVASSRTATHEAGHAVVALACGLSVESVGLSPARTLLASTPDPMTCIRFKLGGPAAEAMDQGAGDPLWLDSATSDRTDADREAFDLTGELEATDALVRSALAEVTEYLEANWSTVQRVALSLLRRPNTLDGTQLRQLASVPPFSQLRVAA